MRRALAGFAAASLLLAIPLTSGAAERPSRTGEVAKANATKIVLRGRRGIQGPWRSYLWLKLVRTDIVSFSVCAVWNQRLLTPACRATAGKTLPEDTLMRLEQRRTTRVARWKRVALSTEPTLEAVLSNAVSGNRLGTVLYRVTLRSPTGHIRATSNTFRVFWQK